jgi:hypothetical protein
MQPEVTDLKMTAQMRRDLQEFIDGYGEDVLGHYPPSLLFDNEPNYHKPVDGFYYAAAGQEVPPEPVKERLSARTVFCWVCFWIIVGELVLLCWPGVI